MVNKKQITEEIMSILSRIDKLADSSKYVHQVAREYVKIRDLYFKKLKDEKEAKKIQWIIDVLNFRIEDNKIKEMMSGTTDEGNPWQYPDIKTFTEKAYKIIEGELEKTNSIKLKAHYADFLWLSKENYDKGKIALDNYLKLIKFYEEKDHNAEHEEYFGLDLLDVFQRAFTIARQINYKKNETKEELERLVFNFNPKSSSKNKLTVDLVEIAITHKKEFSRDFFKKLLLVCGQRANILLKDKNFFFARNFLQNAHKIENKIIETQTQKWQREIAESFIIEAGDTNNKENIGGLLVLTNAINAFQQLGDSKKVEEIKKKYKTLSKNVHFKKVSHEVDVKPIVEYAKKQAGEIAKLESDKIIGYLVAAKGILPQYSQVKEMTDKHFKKFVFHAFTDHIILDEEKNIIKKISSKEEKKKRSLFENYNLSLRLYGISLEIIIEELIKENRLTLTAVKDFFKKSWIPEEQIKLLEPGLKLYFLSANSFYNSDKKTFPSAEVIMATDSTILKIEGLIREIFILLGEPIKPMRERGQIQIKSLGSFLLRDRKIMKRIFRDEDFRFFIKFFLTELEPGLCKNLRNKIAHSSFTYREYNFLNLHFILLIILKIGNLKFRKK